MTARHGAVVLTAAVSVGLAGWSSAPREPARGLPVVVLRSPEAPRWVGLLRAAGYSAREGDLATLLGRTGGVVPGDAGLSGSERRRIARWVAGGGRLATAHGRLLREVGVGRGAATLVTAIRMGRLGGPAVWAAPLTVRPPAGPQLVPLAASIRRAQGMSGQVVMGTEKIGSGEVVGIAVDPAGDGRLGYELLPEAATLVAQHLHAPRGPRSQGAEIFVDPGGLHGGIRSSPERIASLEAGARAAQIAAWNYDFTDPAANYDYGSLIAALHARGILAYAWLEPPFVTLRLWQDYPSCREKTETGRDARVDWRSLIALEDPACFRLATQSWRRILTRHPWDGVNVAELYFEPRFHGPRNHTPFSRAALAEFGRDPATDRAAFARFRTRLVTKLNRQLLEFLATLPNAGRRHLELTVIDDTLDPAAGRAVGSDVEALAAVARRAGAALMVEDPYTSWTDGPSRYDRLGRHVSSLMPPSAALLDVNVVPRAGARPTARMTGAELRLALAAATESLGKVGIYSLGTLPRRDLAGVAGAMAAGTATTDLGVFGRWTVEVTAPSRRHGRLSVDGIEWPAAGGTALVPPGNHVLRWSVGTPVGPGLTAFTGQIGTARVSRRSLSFSYDTRPDGLAVVTRRPRSLRIDGARVRLDALADPDGGFVVRLPSGTHRALLRF